jgi:hypothetical protein
MKCTGTYCTGVYRPCTDYWAWLYLFTGQRASSDDKARRSSYWARQKNLLARVELVIKQGGADTGQGVSVTRKEEHILSRVKLASKQGRASY